MRRALGQSRVGHAGTLDPPATGLLVVLVGRATRLARFIGMLPKRYAGTVRFGFETSTDDAAGAPTVHEADPSPRNDPAAFARAVESAMAVVAARTEQTPPPVSAKKLGGVRAYKLVRRGQSPVMKSVPVQIHRLAGTWSGAPGEGDLSIEVECSSGTYVRSIARDIGREAGCPAHLADLCRTGIGPWNVGDALELTADLTEPGTLRPMQEAIAHLPAVILPEAEAKRFLFGQKIAAEALPGPVAVFDAADLLGVADLQDGLLHPDVVLYG